MTVSKRKPAAVAAKLAALGVKLPGAASLAALLQLQGNTLCDPSSRRGLHPLVAPIARMAGTSVLGVLRWPLPDGEPVLVRAQPADASPRPLAGHTLKLVGTPAQFARRAAAEADASGDAAATSLVAAAAAAADDAGAAPYAAGELAASKLRLEHFLLLRVGPFADVWEAVARAHLAKGDETAAFVAAERSTELNPGWGNGAWLQAELLASLGRHEERRDMALAALEAPYWTIGAPVATVQAAAQLSHMGDLRAMQRGLEKQAREAQGAAAPTTEEAALEEALDALDAVVRTGGDFEDARPAVADALERAGLAEEARLARGDD